MPYFSNSGVDDTKENGSIYLELTALCVLAQS